MELRELPRKRWFWYSAAGLALLIGAWWYLETRVWLSPREQIDRLLDRARMAAQREAIVTLRGMLAKDYRDASGMETGDVIGLVQRFFLQTEEIGVRYLRVLHQNERLPPEAAEATVIVVAQITGKDRESGDRFAGVLGPGGDAFLVRLHRREGPWRVAYTEHLDATSPERLLEQLRKCTE